MKIAVVRRVRSRQKALFASRNIDEGNSWSALVRTTISRREQLPVRRPGERHPSDASGARALYPPLTRGQVHQFSFRSAERRNEVDHIVPAEGDLRPIRRPCRRVISGRILRQPQRTARTSQESDVPIKVARSVIRHEGDLLPVRGERRLPLNARVARHRNGI